MDALVARYPFFDDAREAVAEVGVDLSALVDREAPPVVRGRERVERALTEGTTTPADPMRWDIETELLSYPVARVLVSLLDSDAAVEKYATAEAKTAYRRFTEDIEGGRETADAVTLKRLLAEFDLEDAVRPESGRRHGPGKLPAWYRVDIGPYLTYVDSDWEERWRLVNRELADGAVRVRRVGRGDREDDELYRLLQAAVRSRIAKGLPFEGVEDAVASELETSLADLRDLLAERSVDHEFDVNPRPECFPPCMRRLLERARSGEEISREGRFALLSFLAAIGADGETAVTLCGQGPVAEAIRRGFSHHNEGSGSQYPPPSCETLAEYGLCENTDTHRDFAGHPVSYYARQLKRVPDNADSR